MKCFLGGFFLLAFAYPVLAQQAVREASAAFEAYAVTQYITTMGGIGPKNILDLDNKGAIVLAARKGVLRTQLEAQGIPYSESQITLLETWRLMEENNDTLTTSFPLLGPEETRQLRQHIQAIAPALAEQVEPQACLLVDELHRSGREENAYTILFSYVLDGLVWDLFEAQELLVEREITAETPLWAGDVWALASPRAFTSGTNSISEDGIALKVNWTEQAIPVMLPFMSDFSTLVHMFDEYKAKGFTTDERVHEVFGPFDLLGSLHHTDHC